MGVYNNNNGVLTPIANETQFIAPVNEYVTKPELDAIVPSDTSADNKLVNNNTVNTKLNDVWKAQGELGAKNLLKYPYAQILPKTIGGITFSDEGEGKIGVSSGTSQSYASYDFYNENKKLILPVGDYILSCNSDEIFFDQKHYFTLLYKESTSIPGVVLGTCRLDTPSVNITITQETYDNIADGNGYLLLRLVYEANTVINNDVIVKPMIRLASDPDATWQPYAPTNYELMQSDNALAEGLAKFGKKLWQGNFTSGSIEVAGAAKYTIFIVMLDTIACIGTKNMGGTTSMKAQPSYAVTWFAYRLVATTSGDNIIFTINETNLGGCFFNSNGAGTARAITEIYGLF